MNQPKKARPTDAVQNLVNQLGEALNGARIEVVPDLVTGNPVVVLSPPDPEQAKVAALAVRCLTAFAEMGPEVQIKTPSQSEAQVMLLTNIGNNMGEKRVSCLKTAMADCGLADPAINCEYMRPKHSQK